MTRVDAGAAPRGPVADRGRRAILGAGACLAGWALTARAGVPDARLRDSRTLMGTQVDIAAQGADSGLLRAAVDAAFVRMGALEAVMSHYAPTSRLAAINLAAGIQPVPVPRELLEVLHMAADVSRRSSGAFDATIGSVGRWHFDPQAPRRPTDAYIREHLGAVDWRQLALDERAGTAYLRRRGMRLDLGGIAKLYILQEGLAALRSHGVRTALVNGGGDVVAMAAPGATPWRVGIRDPRAPAQLLASLELRDGFVASSGDYERFFLHDGRRYHHVLDPRTGYPSEGPRGVTLVGRELQAVNGLGAAAMVLGLARGRELIRSTEGVQGLIASASGELWLSPALRERLRPAGIQAG
ncbi:FAD:protein FMN transferase [Ramlibacter tataouinensis]|uniref:FAD:protein FMN transferase n=1 Tax=Ramlibacter tataouinensis TaxID=94132 RepID=UPI0022F3A1A7|nr:FAD:protein FMN transferase [Ramlibacter tataouinensis]WBX99966.1 FAD:protein FMN transferase [Ramlibacter tataouinensis]